MGKTASELRGDIEQRRRDLTSDLDAIGDRVSPGRVLERRTEGLKTRFRTTKESIMGQADSITDTSVDLRDRIGDAAGSARSSVGDAASKAADGVHHAAERVGDAPGAVRSQTQGNPLAAGLVAFGLGLLVSTVLPETRRERRLVREVQPRIEDAARTAAGTGRAMADDLRPAAEQSATHLQESAKASVERVADEARDAAGTVASDTKTAAANVKDAAEV
jgi:gas vesicle protein